MGLVTWSPTPVPITLSFLDIQTAVPWFLPVALGACQITNNMQHHLTVAIDALLPLHDALLQTAALVLATVCGHLAYLPIMWITAFPGRANPAWLTILRMLHNHAQLVKAMGETTIGKLHDAAAGAAALQGEHVVLWCGGSQPVESLFLIVPVIMCLQVVPRMTMPTRAMTSSHGAMCRSPTCRP